MFSTGIVRRIDDLGRLVLPREIRHRLGFQAGDPIEMAVKGRKIVLSKYEDDRIQERCSEILSFVHDCDLTQEQKDEVEKLVKGVLEIVATNQMSI